MKKSLEVKIPLTPNFIRCGNDSIPIEDFTEEELTELGRRWTENLIEKAKKKQVSF